MPARGEVIIIMGVSGSGKSTVGCALAKTIGFTFLDADDFHPEANIVKMKQGLPLTDNDRRPWLEKLVHLMDQKMMRGENIVLACSALRCEYRNILCSGRAVPQFVFLEGSMELIEARLRQRSGHFMPAKLLKSQFDTLEIPVGAICISIDRPVNAIVGEISDTLWPTGLQK